MNARLIQHHAAGRSVWVALAAWLALLWGAMGGVEEKFEVLQIGTRTYTNVTVTTKAKDYIFILHAGGMTSIKTAELPLELKQQLGYAVAGASNGGTNNSANWAKQKIAQIGRSPLKELGKQIQQQWRGNAAVGSSANRLFASKFMILMLGIALLVYLFHCYCCMLICVKTGKPPGVLIWIPVLQLYPLIRAAGMSGWWFLGMRAGGQSCGAGTLELQHRQSTR